MDNVIPFPIKDRRGLRGVLDLIHESYLQSGMAPELASAALQELEPLLEPLIGGCDSVFELPGDLELNEEQLDAISAAHSRAAQALFDHYAPRLNRAIATIASLVRREYMQR